MLSSFLSSYAALCAAAAFAFDVVPISAGHAAESDEAAFEPNTVPVWMIGIPGFGRVLGCQSCEVGGGGAPPAEGLFARTK